MELLKKIRSRAPEYDAIHEELIMKFTVGQGGRAGRTDEQSGWEQGKYFQFKYEIYMYATLLGLKSNYRLPLGENKNKFIEIKSWQPPDLADYIIMSVLANSEIDFNDLENKEDTDIEKEILNQRKLMEEYANGGFDKIKSKLESEPTFFDNNDNCFIDLLDEIS